MGYIIRNKDTTFLCPYCKKADFDMYKEAWSKLPWGHFEQIVCRNCRWFKKNVDSAVAWGPYNPQVTICGPDGETYHNNADMTVLSPPPEETLPIAAMPDTQARVCNPTQFEEVPKAIMPQGSQTTPRPRKTKVKPPKKRKKKAPVNDSRWEEL